MLQKFFFFWQKIKSQLQLLLSFCHQLFFDWKCDNSWVEKFIQIFLNVWHSILVIFFATCLFSIFQFIWRLFCAFFQIHKIYLIFLLLFQCFHFRHTHISLLQILQHIQIARHFVFCENNFWKMIVRAKSDFCFWSIRKRESFIKILIND